MSELAMNDQVDLIIQSTLSLPDEDQLRVVAALTAAIEERGLGAFDDEWLSEAQRRSDAYDAGHEPTISWAEVKRQARERIARTAADG